MKLILKEDISKLGRKGDIVNVAKGYGRNYLIPKNMAMVATTKNVTMAERMQQKRQAVLEESSELADSIQQALADAHLVISQTSTDEGTLYAAVTNAQIIESIEKFSTFKLEEQQVIVENQVKEIGLHTIKIQLSSDVNFDVTLEIVPETK
ncbi:50S ribosomal protein L9 [Acidimicrobiia bacterium]|jgi:large subunit ribosomal protein L9|nr:50S ribosomal protein L9 [Acidimicrobiia bacterium]MDA9275904.1 50S ribosomal protein L9 [Acidimicrobiia bacterium]MDB4249701.1 50S ribosomal protein L9 [Acidimicrobiia bacterium]MDC1070775.1 50S ribosomal protein L9 [Acidimicrobiia bacterium]|tara:strand:+ start:295 stop:747 length:453 start_codon:yes stop_codon:yes gene_type:complete